MKTIVPISLYLGRMMILWILTDTKGRLLTMVDWIDKEKLVSYDEIDKAVESYKNDLMEHCMGDKSLDCEYIRFLSGCIHALKQLKRNHTKEWEASMPPEPLYYRIP